MFVCHMCHGWGVIVMGKNVIDVCKGSFLMVNMDQCKDIMGRHLSTLHQLFSVWYESPIDKKLQKK